MNNDDRPLIAVVGGGPAGLMAAEVLAAAGAAVHVFDAMPSVGRKFLMAGKGGMNITHAEPFERFVARYGAQRAAIEPLLTAFPPDALRAWIHGLGIETFVGSSGRVFPKEMKAAPLLRAWLHRLREAGVRFHVRHRWLGWEGAALRFATPAGDALFTPSATVLALGGGSWGRLGSDGAWVPLLGEQGIAIAPLQPSNCGFDVGMADGGGWSAHFRERFAGEPVKSVRLTCADDEADQVGREVSIAGEFVITKTGVEGGSIYALSARLREAINHDGQTTLYVDLAPGRDLGRVLADVSHPRGSRSLSSHLAGRVGIKGVKAGLLRECLPAGAMADPALLAAGIKRLPIRLAAPRPLDEAISSAGGVCFAGLDHNLMLRALPGTFCAGEMLDWEAPTGGYLLSACFASGRAAGLGAAQWLQSLQPLTQETGRTA